MVRPLDAAVHGPDAARNARLYAVGAVERARREVLPKRDRPSEARARGDLLDGRVARLQQPPGLRDAQADQPLERRGAGLDPERRANVRGLYPAWRAISSTVSGSASGSSIHARVAARPSPAAGGSRRSTNCAWPPSRCGATTIVRAIAVDDGDIVNVRAPACGLELAIHMLERFGGPGPAEAAARELQYERPALAVS